MLAFPPGLNGFNVNKEKGHAQDAQENYETLRKTLMWLDGYNPGPQTCQDDIWGAPDLSGSDHSTDAPIANSDNLVPSMVGSNEEEGDQLSGPEPEKELDPDSSAGSGSFEHDTEHWLWMLEQMTNGYCPGGLPAGPGTDYWGSPAYDTAAWSQSPFANTEVDIMELAAASLRATQRSDFRNNGGGSDVMQLAAAALEAANGKMIDPLEWHNVCTVMMRNLPNQVTQELLTVQINNAGFLHAYDFIYLPIDPETDANRGYAFINFTTPGLALMFKMHFEGRKLANFNSNKVVSVVPAALQGFDANYAHCTKKMAEETAKPTTRERTKKSQRGGRHKAESLIDIAARSQKQTEVQEGQLQEFAQADSPTGSTPPPPGLSLPTEAPQQAPAAKEVPKQATVVKEAPKQAAVEEPDTPKKFVAKFCPYCGGNLKAGFKFCRFCGSSVSF